jgi:hypothetical protein
MIDNKRRFTRIPFKVRAQIIVADKPHLIDELKNLSIGGCFLPAKVSLRVGTPCRIVILVSENNGDVDVQIEGVVVRCEPQGVGIRFTGIDLDNLIHLKNIIRYNTTDSETVECEIKMHPGLK